MYAALPQLLQEEQRGGGIKFIVQWEADGGEPQGGDLYGRVDATASLTE